jgi:hypothetical protein
MIALGAAIAACVAIVAGDAQAQELPPPSAGTVLTGGLLAPRGMAMGPDGMIYVAEAGTGGDTEFTVGEGDSAFVVNNGFTGRISRIDPETGARTTVADGLPSGANPELGDQVGAADVAFMGGDLFLLLTHGGAEWGFPDTPTGIYEVADDGELTLVADIGEFNKDNPVEAITSGAQVDVEVGGNPYSMIVRGDTFFVSDGNHNRLMEVTAGGDISEVTEFPDHPVSTGIAATESGPIYVGYLGRGPFFPEDGKVVSVNAASGAITELASGASMITDVQQGPGDALFALQFNDTVEAGEQLFAPGTGKVLTVNPDGTFSPLVVGLSFASDMMFDEDTLYISNGGITPAGQIIKIENFSDVELPAAPTPVPTSPPAPAPTATPGSGVTAPDTGSGTPGDGGSSTWLLGLLAVAGAALAGTGVLAAKRR